MNVRKNGSRSVVRCGREISSQELEAARETVKLCSGLSRTELAETICEHWGWVTASGASKVTADGNLPYSAPVLRRDLTPRTRSRSRRPSSYAKASEDK